MPSHPHESSVYQFNLNEQVNMQHQPPSPSYSGNNSNQNINNNTDLAVQHAQLQQQLQTQQAQIEAHQLQLQQLLKQIHSNTNNNTRHNLPLHIDTSNTNSSEITNHDTNEIAMRSSPSFNAPVTSSPSSSQLSPYVNIQGLQIRPPEPLDSQILTPSSTLSPYPYTQSAQTSERRESNIARSINYRKHKFELQSRLRLPIAPQKLVRWGSHAPAPRDLPGGQRTSVTERVRQFNSGYVSGHGYLTQDMIQQYFNNQLTTDNLGDGANSYNDHNYSNAEKKRRTSVCGSVDSRSEYGSEVLSLQDYHYNTTTTNTPLDTPASSGIGNNISILSAMKFGNPIDSSSTQGYIINDYNDTRRKVAKEAAAAAARKKTPASPSLNGDGDEERKRRTLRNMREKERREHANAVYEQLVDVLTSSCGLKEVKSQVNVMQHTIMVLKELLHDNARLSNRVKSLELQVQAQNDQLLQISHAYQQDQKQHSFDDGINNMHNYESIAPSIKSVYDLTDPNSIHNINYLLQQQQQNISNNRDYYPDYPRDHQDSMDVAATSALGVPLYSVLLPKPKIHHQRRHSTEKLHFNDVPATGIHLYESHNIQNLANDNNEISLNTLISTRDNSNNNNNSNSNNMKNNNNHDNNNELSSSLELSLNQLSNDLSLNVPASPNVQTNHLHSPSRCDSPFAHLLESSPHSKNIQNT